MVPRFQISKKKKLEIFFQNFSRFWNFGALFKVKQLFFKQTSLKNTLLEFAHIHSTYSPDLSRLYPMLGIDVQFWWHILKKSTVCGSARALLIKMFRYNDTVRISPLTVTLFQYPSTVTASGEACINISKMKHHFHQIVFKHELAYLLKNFINVFSYRLKLFQTLSQIATWKCYDILSGPKLR